MEQARPHLVVADILMPHVNGYALYEAILARPEWEPIPFIFMSCKAEKEDVLQAEILGVEDYITKPFQPQELLEMIDDALKRAQASGETPGST